MGETEKKNITKKGLPVDIDDLLLGPLTSALQLLHLLCR